MKKSVCSEIPAEGFGKKEEVSRVLPKGLQKRMIVED